MKSSEYLSTLEKGLRVLTCFSQQQPQMSLTEVARATELSPAVARRCLLTLTELGYVGRVGNQYLLRPRVLELSTAFTESFDIDNIVRPALQTLREETGDSASLAVLQGSDVLYICHASALRVIRLQATTGTRFPALVTSLGRAILSAMTPGEVDAHIFKYPVARRTEKTTTDSGELRQKIAEARALGYAVVSDELDYGITSIACPVILSDSRVVGAINCSAATSRVDPETFVDSRLPFLTQARDDLTRQFEDAPELVRAIQPGGE